jgi:hypothetical protein
MMRPRFSLRWLLIAFTVLSLGFYLLFVRPTVLANEFIAAINGHDYERANSLFEYVRTIRGFTSFGGERSWYIGEVRPREWSDVWQCRRIIRVEYGFNLDTGQRAFNFYSPVMFEATPFGIQRAFGVE